MPELIILIDISFPSNSSRDDDISTVKLIATHIFPNVLYTGFTHCVHKEKVAVAVQVHDWEIYHGCKVTKMDRN